MLRLCLVLLAFGKDLGLGLTFELDRRVGRCGQAFVIGQIEPEGRDRDVAALEGPQVGPRRVLAQLCDRQPEDRSLVRVVRRDYLAIVLLHRLAHPMEDGTVAQVLKELAGTGRAVAVLPVGTANNISRTLGIVGDAREIVAGWRKARPRPFDVGLISTPDGEHRFVESAGGGLFAAAIRDGEESVEDSATFLGNEIDRSLSHLRSTIEEAKPRKWRVEIDGVDYSGTYLAVEAMNIRHAGASVPVAPNADPGDGLLDVVLIRKRARPDLIRYLDQRLAQQAVKPPKLKVRRGRRVELRVNDGPMRVDDQVVGHVRANWKITLEPGAVNLLWSGLASSRR